MKIKISKFWLLFAFFLFPLVSRAAFTYTPLEKIPGSESSTSDVTDFYAYLSAIYKFGIWAIGIAALLMITIGGYMYITSAGNNTSMEKAKGVITDAIVGLVLALTAYLLLYIINPDLVKIQRLPIITGNGAPTSAVPGAVTPPVAPPATPAAAGGSCNAGSCSQVNSAISANSSGINATLLKSVVDGGEKCNSNISPKGACGYSQVMPLIRNAYCNGATCAQLQADHQLDINCGAAYIAAEIQPYCKGNASCTGSCYNLGMTICRKNPNNCGEANYCQRVQSYFNTCNQ